MTGGLDLDLYVEMTSPRMRVTVEQGVDSRLEVRIGAPHTSVTGETSTVHLWFTRPEAVIELGKELMSKGWTCGRWLPTTPPSFEPMVMWAHNKLIHHPGGINTHSSEYHNLRACVFGLSHHRGVTARKPSPQATGNPSHAGVEPGRNMSRHRCHLRCSR